MTKATARKTSLKMNTGPIVTIFDCPILFAFYNVGKVRYKWIGVRDVKLNTIRDLRCYAQVVTKTVNEVISRCCVFCRGWLGLVHKCVLHVQHAYFHSLDQSNS